MVNTWPLKEYLLDTSVAGGKRKPPGARVFARSAARPGDQLRGIASGQSISWSVTGQTVATDKSAMWHSFCMTYQLQKIFANSIQRLFDLCALGTTSPCIASEQNISWLVKDQKEHKSSKQLIFNLSSCFDNQQYFISYLQLICWVALNYIA